MIEFAEHHGYGKLATPLHLRGSLLALVKSLFSISNCLGLTTTNRFENCSKLSRCIQIINIARNTRYQMKIAPFKCQVIKPTILIGTSGVGRTFTKEIVETMAANNEKPLIMALSNPTSQSECTAEDAYTWSEGRAIFASGSPFAPFEYNGKTHVTGQANNAYVFPGFGLGLIMSGIVREHDDLLLAASEALAAQTTEENHAKGLIYPPFANIRKISAHIAANVAAKAYELGLASRLPRPKDLVQFAESCMYTPVYRNFR